MKRWHHYLSLPHEFGADPDDGVGCDCVIMVWNVLRDAGIDHPPYDPNWLSMASRGEWAALKDQWLERTVVCSQQEYALTLFDWLPSKKVANLEYRTFR